jgi:hypothetical protein
MTAKKEIWKPYREGTYEASTLGRVRRAKPGRHTRIGLVLKGWVDRQGYIRGPLSINNKLYCRSFHRIVAEVFLGPCPKGKEVHHKDNIKSHNWVGNLEYITHLQNIQHSVRMGTRAMGERNGSSVLTEEDVRSIRALHIPYLVPVRLIANLLGFSVGAVGNVIEGVSWKHVK